MLQELKAPQEKFPLADIRKAGYGAIWHGQKAWNGVAILARGTDPVETRRGLPGDPEDLHSRYVEAAVGGLSLGCLYLPNGNPAPGPRFDYKLAWFERLQKYGKTLIDDKAAREAALAFERERKRRDNERRKEEAAREKERRRREQAIAKAERALDEAKRDHEAQVEAIERDRAALERRSQAEDARWAKQKEQLETALRRARD